MQNFAPLRFKERRGGWILLELLTQVVPLLAVFVFLSVLWRPTF